jgi:Family of unknown function (DUF6644)
MQFDSLLKSLEATSVARVISENDLLFPWIESFHVLAIALVVGSIAVVDLRLIGWASRDRALLPLTKDVLPCTWIAFLVAACTGILLFISKAVTYGHNFFFLGKMVLLVLAGINMAVFHLLIGRDLERWGTTPHTTPLPARIAGAVSLCLWITVVVFGRWIGFTLHALPTSG